MFPLHREITVLGALMLGSAAALGEQPAQAKPSNEATKPRTDLYGDPLPPGAVARLGSLRLRHYGLNDLVFSADGKTLVSTGADRVVRFWDVGTGKAVRVTKLQRTPGQNVSLSPDGKLLVSWDNGTLL